MTDSKKVVCGQCGGVRNCEVLATHEVNHADEDYSWWTHWNLLKCRGCDFVFLMTESGDSESYTYGFERDGSEYREADITTEFYPALTKRDLPDWIANPKYFMKQEYRSLNSALDEVYKASANDLHVLTAIGIRTVFDIAAEILGVDPELKFPQKLDALVEIKTIVEADKEHLKTLIDAGSASAHRGWKPRSDEVNTLMDMLEHFIDNAFVQPMKRAELSDRVKKVSEKVPKRKSPIKIKGESKP